MSSLTIGLLVDRLDGEYPNSLVVAFAQEVRSRGMRGVCFVGGETGAADQTCAGLTYELARHAGLDGVIVGTLGGLSTGEPAGVLDALGELPLCTYSIALPGVPRVSVDNRAGMQVAVEHLIVQHRHRTIAFIRGPDGNLDAELRHAGYQAALKSAGIEPEASLVAGGDFTEASGEEAVRLLVEERRLGFDALVAANDAMAVGAMRALVERGIRVPRDVAVVGFDDAEDSRFARPPLSTVGQPWRAQASLAVDLIEAQNAGRRVTQSPAVAADFIARISCGCGVLAAGVHPGSLPPRVVEEQDWLSAWAFALRRHLLTRHIELDQARAGELVAAFWACVEGGADEFLPLLAAELGAGPSSASLSGWHEAILQLRTEVHRRVPQRPEVRWAADDLTHAALQIVSYAAERHQALRRLAIEREGRRLVASGQQTMTTFSAEGIRSSLTRDLPTLGVRSGYLVRYPSGCQPDHDLSGVVQLAFDVRSAEPLATGQRTEAGQLLPDELRASWPAEVYVAYMLSFQQELIGHLVLELGSGGGTTYRAIQRQVTAALKGADLAAAVKAQAEQRQLDEKRRLESEVAIAREVQRSILSGNPRAEGLDVAAGMFSGSGSPAAYYDVRRHGAVTWAAVGQVRSEGMPPGLLVPVLQSAVAALCHHHRDASAQEVFELVSSALADQRQRLSGVHAEVSLILARCTKQGAVEAFGNCRGAFIQRRGQIALLLSPNRSGTFGLRSTLSPQSALVLMAEERAELSPLRGSTAAEKLAFYKSHAAGRASDSASDDAVVIVQKPLGEGDDAE